MDRTRSGMRTGMAWLRRLAAVAVLLFSAFTVYRSYAGAGGPFDGSWWPFGGGEETDLTQVDGTTGATAAGSGTMAEGTITITGLIPSMLMDVRVDSEAPGYPAANLIDGDPATAWACQPCRQPDNPGMAEEFTVAFSSPVGLERIEIVNGMPGDAYYDNNSIQILNIIVDAGALSPVTFANSPSPLVVNVPQVETGTVTFTVESLHRSIAEGAGFGVSEIAFYGTYEPAGG